MPWDGHQARPVVAAEANAYEGQPFGKLEAPRLHASSDRE